MAATVPHCKLCGHRMERSHSRSMAERLFKQLTPLRPHRCTKCGARAWRRPAPPGEIWYPEPPRDRSSGKTR